MKLVLFPLLLAGLFFTAHAQITEEHHTPAQDIEGVAVQTQSALYLRDSAYQWKIDTAGTDWDYYRRLVYSAYDDNNNLLHFYTQHNTDSGLVFYEQQFFQYNVNNNKTKTTTKLWVNNAWENFLKDSNTYDVHNKITLLYTENTPDDINWAPYRKSVYTYSPSTLLLTVVNYDTYNSDTFELNSVNTYTYDIYNNVTTHFYEVTDVNGLLHNQMFITYTYNQENQRTTTLAKYWVNNAWENDYRQNLSYDPDNNLESILREDWANNTWVNQYKSEYSYNSMNSILTYTSSEWDGTGWVTNNDRVNTYNPDNILTTTLQRQYDNSGAIVEYADSTVYYYHTVTPTCYAGFLLYPDTIEHNWLVSATVNGVIPFTYLWQWGDGTTSTEANPEHTYSNPGYYNICLTITDSDGCSDTYCDSSTYVYKTGMEMIHVNVINHINETGVPDTHAAINYLQVYPNPAAGSVTFEAEFTAKATYYLNDITGKTLLQGTVATPKFTLDISSLSSGVYFIAVTDGERQVNGKVVKQ